MSARLDDVIHLQSQLRKEAGAYLQSVAERMAELPPYYPSHLRGGGAGTTPFDDLRQVVQVGEDRAEFERWLAEDRERRRAAGQEVDRTVYAPARSRPEDEPDGSPQEMQERPAPPPPIPWDEYAGERFPRAVILGDPGFGKTWLLRYETRRLARAAAEGLRGQTIGLDDVVLPIFVRMSDLNRTEGNLEDVFVNSPAKGHSDRFARFVRNRLETGRCVLLLDAWDEVPLPRDELRRRLEEFARKFPQPRILLTSRIVGYDSNVPPIPDAQELKLLAFDQPQIESFVGVWYPVNPLALADFLEMLDLHDDLRQAVGNARLLIVMCRTGRACRTKLYGLCLEDLLQDGHTSTAVLLKLLGELGWMHLVNDEGREFSELLLRKTVCGHVSASGLHMSNQSLINGLLRIGVIRMIDGRTGKLSFLHPAFRDYLAARELAGQLRGLKWKQEVLDLPEGRYSAEQLLDEKADDPAWQEVFVFLAGLLPAELALVMVQQLAGSGCLGPAQSGDRRQRRLLLAARCACEIKS